MNDGQCEIFVADCHLRIATELIAHTWDPLVLMALRRGPTRRRDLHAAIGGVSDKVLTQSLTRLVARGLIARAQTGIDWRGVSYTLSSVGASLTAGPLAALAQWAADNAPTLDEVEDHLD